MRAAVLIVLLLAGVTRAEVDVAPLRTVAVMHEGRVKPLDTVARETVRLVTGRESFDRRDPLATMLDWAARPAEWETTACLDVPLLELRTLLSMPQGTSRIAPASVRANAALAALLATADANTAEARRLSEEDRPSRLERAAAALRDRLAAFDAVAAGRSPASLTSQANWPAVLEAVRAGGVPPALASEPADVGRIGREVWYHRAHPFRWAAGAYVVALLALLAGRLRGGAVLYAIALLLHAGAFAVRCSITGWAPVTNLYESVVWAGAMSAVIAGVIAVASRRPAAAVAGAAIATLATALADVIPAELGRSIRALQPVLQSNLWLTTHVLVIVSSYAAFLLAGVMGNYALWQFVRGRPAGETRATTAVVYRAVQVGVLLVAAGTILGGIWASQSWGRFWGWDPKEVWALVILLTYLAILHARFTGWVADFGLAVGAAAGMATVLMSWYGVNFLLGAGLHSYGFGAGGEVYAGAAVAVQALWLAVAFARRRSSLPPGFEVQHGPSGG